MLYVPDVIAAADVDIVKSPYFGGEFLCYMTQKPAVLLGQVELSAAGAGVYVDNLATALTGPTNVQLIAATPIRSSVATVIKVAGLDSSATPASQDGTATFSPPTRALNQTYNFGRGIGVDVVAAKTFTSITGLSATTPITGGGPLQVFRLYQLPEMADYTLIRGRTEVDFNTKSRVAKGIDDGMESDAWVKRGKSQPGELSIGSKFQSFMEGMARFDGQKCVCMLVGLKDGQVRGDVLVFTEYTPTVKSKLPEGDGEATMEAAGKFVDHGFFCAPGPTA